MSNRILLVEDDQSFGAVLKDYLTINNFEVTLATDGEQGLKEFTENEFDICIFDVMMPKKDGFSLAEDVKKIDKNTPIIFLTARNMREDILKGYQIGADDYITKPFNPLEVMARVKSLLRRTKMTAASEQPDILEVRSLIINRDSHEVKTLDGGDIQLTALEFGILYLLASHPNRVFSADEIFERVWKQESVVSAKTVMVHVSHLRDKIEEATGGEKIIQTVWGVGYKIDAK